MSASQRRAWLREQLLFWIIYEIRVISSSFITSGIFRIIVSRGIIKLLLQEIVDCAAAGGERHREISGTLPMQSGGFALRFHSTVEPG